MVYNKNMNTNFQIKTSKIHESITSQIKEHVYSEYGIGVNIKFLSTSNTMVLINLELVYINSKMTKNYWLTFNIYSNDRIGIFRDKKYKAIIDDIKQFIILTDLKEGEK